ncbi:MAG: DUF4126 domain-containing protein [Candidatus Omnitrophica bacterium]|nr:DUF4126 domain-containing protein [Candidatus Omnitrophota bacterium]
MEQLASLGLLMGGSWASGINLYLTVAALGILHRTETLTLPGQLDVFGHPLVIGVAIVMYCIEFVADKVPVVDSTWDAVHTFIRPAGGLLLGYLGGADFGPQWQVAAMLITGAIATDAHLTKAAARAAINTSPEPVSNSIASVTEDVSVVGVMYLIVTHPVVAVILVMLFIFFSIWFLTKMFHLLKKVFARKDQCLTKNQERGVQ